MFKKSKTGCWIIPTKKFEDVRGYFTELYRGSVLGISFDQDNLSYSHSDVVRGMHFQTKNPQGKLVRVLSGQVIDVALDLRVGSPTYGEFDVFDLSPHSDSVYIPPGFAHGFFCLTNALFHYKCTTEYDPKSDTGLHPLDRDMRYPWGLGPELIIAEKDKKFPCLKDFHSPFTMDKVN